MRPCEPGPSAAAMSVQRVDDLGDLRLGCRSPRRQQQLLGGLAEVARLPHAPRHLVGLDAGRGGDRADRQLLGQPEVDAGELGRDQALAQVTDGGQ